MRKRSRGSAYAGGGRLRGPLRALLALGALGGIAAAALAVPGDLDLRFGADGKRVIDLGGSDQALDVAVRPDGRLVAAGVGGPANDVALVSLSSDGGLDSTWGMNSFALIDLGGVDVATGVAVRPDGRILVAGATSAGAGGSDDIIALQRTPSGNPDAGFATRVLDTGGLNDSAEDVALRPDGRAVLVGSIRPVPPATGAPDVEIRALLEGGGDDLSFDGDGVRIIDLGGGDEALAVAVQPDGRILVAGHRRTDATGDDGFVGRLTPEGGDDGAFGTADGRRVFAAAGDERFTDLALQPDGRIVVVGTAGADMVVRRLLPAGGDDPSFNGGQPLIVDIGADDEALAVGLQPNGKIVIAGGARPSGLRKIGVARVQPGGTLDTTFHFDGVRTVDLGGSDGAQGLAIDRAGRAVVAGATFVPGVQDLAVVRLDGDPDVAAPGPGPPAPGAPPVTATRAPRCGGKAATIVGTARRDRLRGTPRADVIAALGGRDTVLGLGGNDVICGGGDRDVLDGGAGADRLIGGPGRDVLRGGSGRDTVLGGPGRDACEGGAGRDRGACERLRGL